MSDSGSDEVKWEKISARERVSAALRAYRAYMAAGGGHNDPYRSLVGRFVKVDFHSQTKKVPIVGVLVRVVGARLVLWDAFEVYPLVYPSSIGGRLVMRDTTPLPSPVILRREFIVQVAPDEDIPCSPPFPGEGPGWRKVETESSRQGEDNGKNETKAE